MTYCKACHEFVEHSNYVCSIHRPKDSVVLQVPRRLQESNPNES